MAWPRNRQQRARAAGVLAGGDTRRPPHQVPAVIRTKLSTAQHKAGPQAQAGLVLGVRLRHSPPHHFEARQEAHQTPEPVQPNGHSVGTHNIAQAEHGALAAPGTRRFERVAVEHQTDVFACRRRSRAEGDGSDGSASWGGLGGWIVTTAENDKAASHRRSASARPSAVKRSRSRRRPAMQQPFGTAKAAATDDGDIRHGRAR